MDTVSDEDFFAVAVCLVVIAVSIHLHTFFGDQLRSWPVNGDG